MKLFKPKYKARDGSLRKTAKWYVDFQDHLDRRHKWPLFTDKRTSERCAEYIDQLIACRSAGDPPDSQLTRWLETLPARLLDLLIRENIIDAQKAMIGKTMSAHLADFKVSLKAANSSKYVTDTFNRVDRLFRESGCRYWSEVKADAVEAYLSGRLDDGISKRTYNADLQAVKQFCVWMMNNRRTTANPLRHLKKLNHKTAPKRLRRPLSVEELRLLIGTTQVQPTRYGMTGPVRAILYRLAAETGLRANELRSLTVSSFNFDNATVTVEAAYSKRKRLDVLPVRPDTLSTVAAILERKMPNVKAFTVPEKTARMLREDLLAAEIECLNETGQIVDFHSLRHTTGTLLAASGVHPKTAQSLMRLSDINLTMQVYTHVLTGQDTQAINSLPDLSVPLESEVAMTGTDEKVLGQLLGQNRGLERTLMNPNKKTNRVPAIKNAVLTTPPGTRTPNPLIKSQLLCQLS